MKKGLFLTTMVVLLIGQYACYSTTSPYYYPDEEAPPRHPYYENSPRAPQQAPPPRHPAEGKHSKSKKHSPRSKVLYGQVVEVTDGDTIFVKSDDYEYEVRLYGIECPEHGQEGWTKAWSRTRHLCFWKGVEVETVQKGGRGRISGIVWVKGLCVNAALLDEGLAWISPGRCGIAECRDWKELERNARYGRRGLWSEPGPIPPRRHRK